MRSTTPHFHGKNDLILKSTTLDEVQPVRGCAATNGRKVVSALQSLKSHTKYGALSSTGTNVVFQEENG